jgi:hypothetical protein
MQPEELARSIGTLESSAAEGELLSRDVAADRTKPTFARVRARELGEVVDHEAEKLSDAAPSDGIADQKSRAVDLADKISQALGQIRFSPGDERAAQQAAIHLAELSKRAKRLADSL